MQRGQIIYILLLLMGLMLSFVYLFSALQGLHYYFGYWIAAPLLVAMMIYRKNTMIVIASMLGFGLVCDIAWYFVLPMGLFGIIFLIPSLVMISVGAFLKT